MNLNLIYNSWLFNNLTYFWRRGSIYLKNCLTYFYKLFIDAERVNASVKQCDVFIFPDFYGIYFEKYFVSFFTWMKRQRGKPNVTYVLWILFVKIMTHDENNLLQIVINKRSRFLWLMWRTLCNPRNAKAFNVFPNEIKCPVETLLSGSVCPLCVKLKAKYSFRLLYSVDY